MLTPERLKAEAEQAEFRSLNADVAVVVAYGLILPKPILDAPAMAASICMRRCCRAGAAPRRSTGRSWPATRRPASPSCASSEGLDAGPVCLEARAPIGPDQTAGELHDELAARGARLMAQALSALEKGQLDCRPQAENGVTYAKKIEPSETRIDWSRPANEVHNRIRGLSPYPGAWFEIDDQRQARAHPRAALDARRGTRASPGPFSTTAHRRLRRGRRAAHRSAARRQAPDAAEDFLRGVPLLTARQR